MGWNLTPKEDLQKAFGKRLPPPPGGCHSLAPKAGEMARDVGGASLAVLGPQPGPQPPRAMT